MHRIVGTIAAIGLCVAGCSESGPATAPVSGVVTYRGEPVQYARVTFLPQDVPAGRPGFAQTDAEGRFSEVITAGSGSGEVVVGSHFVTVTEAWPPEMEIPVDEMGMQKTPPRGPWAQKYRDSANPALKVEVAAGKDNHFEFDLSE